MNEVVDKYGVICDPRLVEGLDNLAKQFDKLVEDLTLRDACVAQCVLMSSIGFLIASRSVKERIKDIK